MNAQPARRRWLQLFPLSIRTSLVALVFLPLAISVGLASTVVAHQSSLRGQAITARQSSLVLNSLLRARIDVYAEYVASASIVAAQAYHVSAAELDSLLGLNVQASLVDARHTVDQQKVFGPKGAFAPEYAGLQVIRRAITAVTRRPPRSNRSSTGSARPLTRAGTVCSILSRNQTNRLIPPTRRTVLPPSAPPSTRSRPVSVRRASREEDLWRRFW